MTPCIAKQLIFLVWFAMSVALLHGQRAKVDVVTLQNGKVYRGRVLPQADPQKIKLQTPELEILWLNRDDVIKVEKEELTTAKQEPHDSLLSIFAPNRISYSVEGHAGFPFWGSDLYYSPPTGNDFGGQFSAGWNIMGYLRVGAGIGVDRIGSTWLMPLYFNARVRSHKHLVSPMGDLGIGYAFAWDYTTDSTGQVVRFIERWGGFYAFPSIGFSTSLGRRLAMQFLVGLRIQHVHHRQYGWALLPIVIQTETDFLTLKLGVSF